jgi:Mannosyltransferase putative
MHTATKNIPKDNRKALEFTYIIPSDLVPKHPVLVLDRNLNNEQITTPDGRRSFTSTEAFREFGEVVRSLIQQGKANLSSRGDRKSTLLFRLHLHTLAPWLKGDFKDPAWPQNTLPTPMDGRAIVVCAGDPQLHYLKNLVYSIRVDHGSNMPIKIVFLDQLDLTPPSQAEVESIVPHGRPKNLDFVDLSQFFNLKQVHLKGWDLKAYGLLAIPENEVMLIDVDVILLQPPENMFEQEGYKDKGVLFFHDRMLTGWYSFAYDPGTFAMAIQPSLSRHAQRLIHNGNASSPYMAEHVQESGMIVIDKTRRILGLWATCLIYGREDVRKYAQGYHMYGDKEMYW